VPSVDGTTQASITATADSYVDSSTPDANFGNSIFLYTHNYTISVAEAGAGLNNTNLIGPLSSAWLKFDLSKIPPQAIVNSIILRMHTAIWGTRSHNIVGVFVCDDISWTETEITWTNAPTLYGATSQQTVSINDPDVDYDFNLTSALMGKSAVSLVLETVQSAKEPAVFNSRDLDNGPTLIVGYTMPTNTALIEIVGIGVIVVITIMAALILVRRKRLSNRSHSQILRSTYSEQIAS
jgi:hypothetical protein